MKSSSVSISTKHLVLCGVMAAVTAVAAQISIPMPSGVPVTLQTFAVALTGYLLGVKPALISAAVYILLGAVGAPVFTGFRGGVGAIAGVTGGFIIGFLPMAGICGIRAGTGNSISRNAAEIGFGIAGIAVCHLLGTVWFSVFSHTPLWTSFLRVSASFLIKDIISVVLAKTAAEAIRKAAKI